MQAPVLDMMVKVALTSSVRLSHIFV